MMGYTSIALLCLFVEGARTTFDFNKHDFYTGPENFIKIPDADIEALFVVLDKNNNGKLERKDLTTVFRNPRADDDIFKFIREADTDDPNKDVDLSEFKQFMSDQSAVWAIAACKSTKKAKKLKLYCYKYRFIAYIHTMLPFDDVVALFRLFDVDGSGQITKDDIRNNIIEKAEDQSEVTFEDVINNIMREWGREDEQANFAEFKSYVRQEDYAVDIKECNPLNITCYKEYLIAYTTYSLTEMDTSYLFQKIDKGNDGILDHDDILAYTFNPEHFISIVDTDENVQSVNFEEFRLFMKRVIIKNTVEKNCRFEFNRDEQITCYSNVLFQILQFAYKFAKISIPHSDIFYIFDDLDKNSDGVIDDSDLANFEKDETLRKNIFSQLDTSGDDNSINFDEIDYFLSYPSSIYALSNCLYKPEKEQTECYINSFIDFTANMMATSELESFFWSYDLRGAQILTKDDVDQLIPAGETHDEDVSNFINELGLGDDEVTLFEFASYVRHLDLREVFKSKTVEEKQAALLNYINKKITEYDIEMVFERFDKNRDGQIDTKDLEEEPEISTIEIQKFLNTLDFDHDEDAIDFKEFRYFILKPENRKILESDCTQKETTQENKIKCYKKKIWEMSTQETPSV